MYAADSGDSAVLPLLVRGSELGITAEIHTDTSKLCDPAVYAMCVPAPSAITNVRATAYVGRSLAAVQRCKDEHATGKGSPAIAQLLAEAKIDDRWASFCLLGFGEIHQTRRQRILGDTLCVSQVSFMLAFAEQMAHERTFPMHSAGAICLANCNKSAFSNSVTAYASVNGKLGGKHQPMPAAPRSACPGHRMARASAFHPPAPHPPNPPTRLPTTAPSPSHTHPLARRCQPAPSALQAASPQPLAPTGRRARVHAAARE